MSLVKRAGVVGAPIKVAHSERVTVATEGRATSPLILEPATGDEADGLIATLTAERIAGFTEGTYTSFDMQRGIDDEPRAVAKYSEHYAPATPGGFMVRGGPGWRVGYSPDGLVGADGLVEVKSRRAKKQLQTILADQVPAENMAQCQAGLLVSGRQWLDYISYCGGMPMWVKRVLPNAQWFDAILTAAERFEAESDAMVARYTEAAAGLHMTERPVEEMMVI